MTPDTSSDQHAEYVSAELPIAEARRLISEAAHLLAVDQDAKAFIPVINQLLGCISTLQGYSDLLYQYERDRREGHVTSDPPIMRNPLHNDGCDIPGCDHRRSNRGYDMQQTDGQADG